MSDPIRPLIDLKISGARGESILDVVRRLALGGAPSDASDAEASLFLAIYSADATTGPPVYVSGTSFSVTGADLTRYYSVGRYIRATGTATGTIYGQVATSSYNAGLDKTTVTVTWVSGSLSNEALAVAIVEAPFATQAAYAATLALAKALIPAGVVLTNGFAVEVAGRTVVNDGYQGAFAYKFSDTTTVFSTANDAYGFVDDQGRRFFRLYDDFSFVRWFGALGDDSTNDTVAVQAAFTNVPQGKTLVIDGKCKCTGTLTLTRPINVVCLDRDSYLRPSAVAGDFLTIGGGVFALWGIRIDINVYGEAASCTNGVVFKRVHASTLNVRGVNGATAYAWKMMGCLTNNCRFEQLGSYSDPPLLTADYSLDHLYFGADTSIYTNANQIEVHLGGGRHGIVTDNMASQGNNTIHGEIQGISGRPMTVTAARGMTVRDLHLEATGAVSTFTSCQNLSIADNVLGNSSGEGISLIGCSATWINEYTGTLSIDAACAHTKIGIHRLGGGHAFASDSPTTEHVFGGTVYDANANILIGSGRSPVENIFLNPFCDIWSAGAAAAPDGWSIGAGSFARDVATVYPGNPAQQSIKITSTAVTLANCAIAQPEYPYLYNAAAGWFSVMVPVYVAAGQPDLTIYLYDGATYRGTTTVTVKAAWVAVRFSALLAGSANVRAVFAPGAPSAGEFYVGGLSLAKGTSAPQELCDNGRRADHVVTAVGYQPSFVGQRAFVAGTTKFYLAKGIAAAGDWIILN